MPSSGLDPAVFGEWSDPFDLANVPVHAHLLPTGQLLYWGRRKAFGSLDFHTLNEHETQTYVWDPASGKSRPTANQPALQDGTPINLFCSGHAFLADGRLMVVGGHLFDSQGLNQSCVFDSATDRWSPEGPMNLGRWYPSAVALPDGGLLALSGSYPTGALQPPNNDNAVNPTPQVWHGGGWQSLTDFKDGLTLFPRIHVEPVGGQVFMAGAQAHGFFFDMSAGSWTSGPTRLLGLRDYAPSVMYDTGKIIFVGGGLDADTQRPTNGAEIIDLTSPDPTWHSTSPMHFRRRQHNATMLADGTVLVTGGTQGPGFNDLTIGSPIRAAECWDPRTGLWTILAEEVVDRCYHATTVLLPDGRVFSGGGGEYAPDNNVANPPKDTHADAQIFSPPYLFRGPRPAIATAPKEISYGERFEVQVDHTKAIAGVTWARLCSTTHSFDQNLRLHRLAFESAGGTLTVSAPPHANACPPGHHLLFVVDESGVPSVGHMARISARQETAEHARTVVHVRAPAAPDPRLTPVEQDVQTINDATRPPVTVGITPTCPYGLAGCWGGAKGALRRLTGVETVLETADAHTSTASVFLKTDSLPDLDVWRREFEQVANGSYHLRGIEMTLSGAIEEASGQIRLAGHSSRPSVLLTPLDPSQKVQWDSTTKAELPLQPDEADAFARLSSLLQGPNPPSSVTATGPLLKIDGGFCIGLRAFTA